MPVPLIVAGIGAVASIYAAKKTAGAVQQATQTQAQAGQQAIALQQQALAQGQAAVAPAMSMFGPGAPGTPPVPNAPPVGPIGVPQGQFGTLGDVYGKILGAQLQNLGPYQSLGTGAAGALGFGLGLGGFQGGVAPMPASASTPGPQLRTMLDRAQGPMRPASELDAQGFPLASLLPPPGAEAPTPGGTTTSGQVPMRGPDGSIKSVPASQVAYWQAKGATLLASAS
jgi:hypothetical protein